MNCPRCDKPIDAHEAGRETDACVAEVVMGKPPLDLIVNVPESARTRRYSTDIAAAWEVVEKIEEGDLLTYTIRTGEAWIESIDKEIDGHNASLGFTLVELAVSDSGTPHAICLAALKAVANT